MGYREIFECDRCGRELEASFWFRVYGEEQWQNTAESFLDYEDSDEMECPRCHADPDSDYDDADDEYEDPDEMYGAELRAELPEEDPD